MKKLLLTSAILVCMQTLFCQDLIYLKDGSEIKAMIIELTNETIKYRRYDHLDGPIRNILLPEVLMIIYEDGTREVIKLEDKTAIQTQSQEKLQHYNEPSGLLTGKTVKKDPDFQRQQDAYRYNYGYRKAAKVSFAPKVGLNLANLGGNVTDNQIRLRTQIGGILNLDLNEMFSFQPGLLYSGKGTTFNFGEGYKEAITLEYIEVPLNGILNVDIGTGKLQIFAGPYLGYCVNATYKYLSDEDNETESIEIGTSENDELKPIDLGFNIGLGFKFGNVQIQGGYSGSITSFCNYDNDKIRNNVISLSFTYFKNL